MLILQITANAVKDDSGMKEMFFGSDGVTINTAPASWAKYGRKFFTYDEVLEILRTSEPKTNPFKNEP